MLPLILQKALHRLKLKGFFLDRKKKKYPLRILAVRNGAIGDVITFLPLLQSLRKTFPYAILTLLTTRTGKTISHWASHCVDEVITVDFSKLFSPKKENRFLSYLSDKKFDLIFLSTFDYNYRELAYLIDAWVIAPEPKFSSFFDFSPSMEALSSEIYRNIQIAKEFIPSLQVDFIPRLYFPKDYGFFLKKWGLKPQNYIVIHFGGKRNSRMPPLSIQKRFLADILKETSLFCVLTGNRPEEVSNNNLLEDTFSHTGKVKNLSGKTTLDELLALVGHSRMVVSSDTGVAHLGAAFQKPQVIFWGPGDIKKWRPMNTNFQLLLKNQVSCSPCYLDDCSSKKCFSYPNYLNYKKIIQLLN